jgi:hypothetical protein
MRALGRFVRTVAPIALLIGPALYTLDRPSLGMSTLGGLCMGIGLSAGYVLFEQIAAAYCAKKDS